MSRSFLKSVECGRLTQAKQLYRQGVSINSKNRFGQPALFLTLRIPDACARASMVQWLLHAGADTGYVDPRTGRNLLATAACANHTADVIHFLEHGNQDTVLADHAGRTSLHYSTVHNNVTAVYELCKYARRYCIPVNQPDAAGWTPFSIATVLGYRHILAVLVQIGADAPEQFIYPWMDRCALQEDYSEFHWFMQGDVLRQRKRAQTPNSLLSPTSSRESFTSMSVTSRSNSSFESSPRRQFSSLPVRQNHLLSPSSSRESVTTPSTQQDACQNASNPTQHHSLPVKNSSLPVHHCRLPVPRFPRDIALSTTDGFSCSSSLTSMDYVNHFLAVKSAQRTPSYRPKAASAEPKSPAAGSEHRSSLSFAMAAKITTMALSLRKKQGKHAADSSRASGRGDGKGK